MLPGMSAISIPAAVVEGQALYTDLGFHSFQVPAGASQLTITAIGGAGGGCSGYTTSEQNPKTGDYTYTDQFGGDGGSAATSVATFAVLPNETVTLYVGAGGDGGAAPNSRNGSANVGAPGADSYATYDSSDVVRADAGNGGTKTADGAGGVAIDSIGDTITPGAAGEGGAGGYGYLQAGEDGADGSILVEWS
jgi:hypothetical protein